MGTSWRIRTSEKDRTNIASTISTVTGATVINSPKGPKEFTLFNKGETQKILDIFGYPTKDYPSIQDAVDAVKSSALWVASPYKEGTYGGVFVTPKGTVPFSKGTQTQSIEDLSKVDAEVAFGKGDDVLTSFNGELPEKDRIDTESLNLVVGETTSKITVGEMNALTDAEGLLTDGSTFDAETGEIALVFALAPTKEDIKITYTIDMSDTNVILFNKNMQGDDLKVQIEKNEGVDNALTIHVYRFNPVYVEYNELLSSPYTVGLNPLSKNNYGSNIFINNVFNEKNQLFTPVVVNEDISVFAGDKSPVALNGGSRGAVANGSDLASTYEQLQDSTTYDIQYAFDGSGTPEVATMFDSLRTNYQKYCRFEFCTPDIPASEIIAEPETYGITSANRGLYCYCLNWGIHKDVYQGNDFLCSNMGLVASKLAQMLEVGGGVPAWVDENGVGGILGGSITKLSQHSNEIELEKLDRLGFNPVVSDVQYGTMIVGWRTRQVKETVMSFIGQSSLADTLLNLITRQVLPKRIGKLVDESAYAEVQGDCNAILRTYSQWIEDSYVLCDSTNNTDETRNNQILNIAVGIVFKGYAQRVNFNFITYKNGTDIKVELSKL